MKKEKKKVLTKEEKLERKIANKYKIFRHKILAIIGAALFVIGFVLPCIFIGSKNTAVSMLSSVGAIIMIVAAFLIFRRTTLSFMLIGAGLIDLSFIDKSPDAESIFAIGFFAAVIALICIFIGMKKQDKRKGNFKIKLDHEFVDTMIFEDEGSISKTITYGSLIETHFKARFYFALAIVSVLACGIGLLLPFGAKAYRYYKAVGFLTCDVGEKESTRYNEKKPFKNMVAKDEVYLRDKTFACKSPFFTFSSFSYFLGFGYIILSMIYSTIVRKPDFMDDDAKTAGDVVFSTNTIEGLDQEVVQILTDYSKSQSEENRQYLIDALNDMGERFNEWSEREGRRLAAYEEEKFRSARKYATGAIVTTDGKDFYVKGSFGGLDGNQKLESYDRTTGVGYYTDANGNKVEIKNTNIKK